MNNDENKTILTDNQLNEIVSAAEGSTKNLDVDIRKIKENVNMNTDVDVEKDVIITSIDPSSSDIMSATMDSDIDISDKDIFELAENVEEKEITEATINSVKDEYNLSEEDVYKMLDLIEHYKNNKNYPVYHSLPESLKKSVRELAMQSGVGADKFNMIARMVLDEFISDAKLEETFVDLERSLDDALNIPSITDMYSEHTNEVMNVHIPEMIEKIKDEYPDKAELLGNIRLWFNKAYDFSFAKEKYEKDARLRKLIRRGDEKEVKNAMRSFNYKNSKSKFIMNDVTESPSVLYKILCDDIKVSIDKSDKYNVDAPKIIEKVKNMNIAKNDINKFIILICHSCINLNPDDIIDASYMYYMLKNIIMLKMTNEAKTDFAVELINNICDTITFIRNKEDEFYEEYTDTSKPRKKPSMELNKKK